MLKIDCLENKAIRDIKSEVLQFRKSTDKRTSMENEIMDIIAGGMSMLNLGDDFEEKYQRHLQMLKNDTAYKKAY